ncbi:MAG: formate acetyltransferase [Desulfobacteraceae bacterium]|nr:formate acetyltransferase [Desulfobacteraceae bacterium]MBC2754238.1 formate acetyltransferase [Desulfobacteraceae bacterium]
MPSTNLQPPLTDRISYLKNSVQGFKPGICTERALIWTKYFKKSDNKNKPACIQIAEAFRDVLVNKTVIIYPNELIIGNFTSKRVGGEILPELLGVPVMEDILKFSGRKTSPLQISAKETWQLLRILPFWLFRFLAMRAYTSPVTKVSKMLSQLKSYFYVMNETGGIAHTIPDHEKLIRIGTDGIIAEVLEKQTHVVKNSDQWHFYEAVKISAQAFALFCRRYEMLATNMAKNEPDPDTRHNLAAIATCFKTVPVKGAATFREALQIVYLAHIAIMIESLDNSIGLGRMDQYLYPFYKKDIKNNVITRDQAKELIAAFSIKMCELVPVFPQRVINFHGGFYNAQVVTVGGMDSDGRDATNALSHIFLEVMNELRMREPNYHARLHANSPKDYVDKIISNLCAGSNTPSLYNDDVIIDTMCKNGYPLADARNYSGVGCVEPIAPGKTFASTNAAMVNVPLILELALNSGRRFCSVFRSGEKTLPISRMQTMDDVKHAFTAQLKFQIQKLINDLQPIERANMKYHPTPFTSMLHEGCIASGTCTTAGGAVYNFSGIQAVAPVAAGDALYAIDKFVFKENKISLPALVGLLKKDINDPKWLAYMKGAKKFGNDEQEVDQWTLYVVDAFGKALDGHVNTRGGKYIMGIYSDTIHEFFGRITGALPYGRRKGESFSSGISPGNGFDKNGPTALINSANRFDFTTIPNGINFNLKFYPHTLKGEKGRALLSSLLKTYFKRGGMQTQINVLDPEELKKAYDNPDLYPNLVVRVSGYTVYFNDLTPVMKQEIIQRTTLSA